MMKCLCLGRVLLWSHFRVWWSLWTWIFLCPFWRFWIFSRVPCWIQSSFHNILQIKVHDRVRFNLNQIFNKRLLRFLRDYPLIIIFKTHHCFIELVLNFNCGFSIRHLILLYILFLNWDLIVHINLLLNCLYFLYL